MKFHLCLLIVFLIRVEAFCEQRLLLQKSYSAAYQLAQDLINQNNLIGATKLYLELNEQDRNSRELILQKLSGLYASRNKTGDYIAYLQNKIKTEPFDYSFNMQLAEEHFVIGQYAEAWERISIVLGGSSAANEKTYKLAGEISFKLKNYDQCVQYGDKILEKSSDSKFLLVQAECYLNLQNYKKAQTVLNLYLQSNEPSQKTYSLKIQIYTGVYDVNKLKKNYRECLEKIPQSEECFYGYLKSFAKQNENFCIQHFEKYEDQFQKSSDILSEMSQLYSSRNPVKKEEQLIKLVNLNSKSYSYVQLLFDHYKNTKQFQKAYELLDEYLKTSPGSEEALAARQTLFIKTEVPSVGGKQLKTPASQEKQTYVTGENRQQEEKARLLYENGHYRESLDILRKISPRTDEIYFRAGNIWFNLKNLSSARVNWSNVKKDSEFYYESMINTIISMRLQKMNSLSLKVFNEINFPKTYEDRISEIQNLFDIYSEKISDEERAKTNIQYKSLMYLDWSP